MIGLAQPPNFESKPFLLKMRRIGYSIATRKQARKLKHRVGRGFVTDIDVGAEVVKGSAGFIEAKIMKAYVYVIATDRGSAPNYEPPCTTLAICKPDIRRCAPIGSLVLAFTGSTFSCDPHAVCWAGVIEDRLTFAQYWDDPRFEGKKPHRSATPDNIYEPDGVHLRQVPNTTHDATNVTIDLSGMYVLLFNEAWHFGAAGPILPSDFGLRMIGGRRRHRVHDLPAAQWAALRGWLNKQFIRSAAVSGMKCRQPRAAPAPGRKVAFKRPC